MASDSEPENVFRSKDAHRRVLEHFGLKINILLHMVSCLQFLHFSSRASEMHMPSICCFIIATFPTLESSLVLYWVVGINLENV
jgi:hypothetical protein